MTRRRRKIVTDSLSVAKGERRTNITCMLQEKESIEGWISIAGTMMLSKDEFESQK